MLKQHVFKLILVSLMALMPVVATAGGIITHGRVTSQNGLEQDDEQETPCDGQATDGQIENEIYLFVSMIMNGHESFASAAPHSGEAMAAAPEGDAQAGGCNQFPVSSLSTLLGFAWLLRRRR